MTDRPILFSSAMIRALLAGTKTQTRRLATSKPTQRIEIGDRLWAREGWACHWATNDQKPSDIDPDLWTVRYLADNALRPAARDGSLAEIEQCKLGRPSIFMPRWASRLTLTVTDKQIQPLQDISEADARAEGLTALSKDGGRLFKFGIPDCDRLPGNDDNGWAWQHWNTDPVRAYARLWDTLHTTEGERWDDNPDVIALTFTVEQGGGA